MMTHRTKANTSRQVGVHFTIVASSTLYTPVVLYMSSNKSL